MATVASALMHPIELLRHVARAEGAGPSALTRDAAWALAGLGDDPAGLVTSCRRLVDRHPSVGPMWWLAARVLTASDQVGEARAAARELDEDPTARLLAASLPENATVVIVGWPELAAEAIHARGDVSVLVVEGGGEASGLCRRLRQDGFDAEDVAAAGLAAAVATADLVLLEAAALGPDGFVATTGSHAAAAVAHHAGLPVLVVAGVGRPLPPPLWTALLRRLEAAVAPPWCRLHEVVPLSLVTQVDGPGGVRTGGDMAASDCPLAPELIRPLVG